jgi:hypothetical protein
MQHKEQSFSPPKESWSSGAPKPETAQSREKSSLKKLGDVVGDVLRDVSTANQMAADKFDGDSALMRTARGFVTTGIGVGLEKSMNFVWDKVWQGDIPFYDKSKFGTGMAEAMNRFAQKSDFNARMYHLMKEGTQDLSLAIFYNFLAFRSQPLLPKAEPKHLLTALTADAMEAFVKPISPNLPGKVQFDAQRGTNAIVTEQIEALDDKMAQFASRSYYDRVKDVQVSPMSDQIEKLKERKKALQGRIGELHVPEEGGNLEKFIHKFVDISNPVTVLGIDMISGGLATLIRNFKEVRKVRKEKGGLEGKKVFMPKKENWKDRGGDRKPYNEKRDYSKDKVYVGKSNWKDKKIQEEYDLKVDDT